VLLSSAFDLSHIGYFQRSGAQEMLTLFKRLITKRTPANKRQTVPLDQGDCQCHVYRRADGLAGVVAADKDYPDRVAHAFLTKLLDDFNNDAAGKWQPETKDNVFNNWEPIAHALKEYQDPSKADKITAITQELEETKQILHNTIDGVLERGVKLDQLVDKSNDLSAQSKMFYKQAKKTNACCVIA